MRKDFQRKMATLGMDPDTRKTDDQEEDLWSVFLRMKDSALVVKLTSRHPYSYLVSRSVILNDVAASSARSRPQVTKTLLVLGKSFSRPPGRNSRSLFVPVYVMCLDVA